MLTADDYHALWTNPMPTGFAMLGPAPAYADYVAREQMIQQYLDIFRGRVTIPGNPFAALIAENKRRPKIKYMMIAESAPIGNTYFYNVNHGTNTCYFKEPIKAFRIEEAIKTQMLFDLANQGVLLLDLFPFIYNYDSPFRELLNLHGTTEYFWHTAPDSICSRITGLIDEGLVDADNPLLNFIAPPIISHQLATQLNAGAIAAPAGIGFRPGVNYLTPAGTAVGSFLRTSAMPSVLNGVYTINLKLVPYYACCAYSGSNVCPHWIFIRNSFYLP